MNTTKMGMNNESYTKYVESKSYKSTIVKNCAFAFLIGGLICVVGQIIYNLLLYAGMDEINAGTLTSVLLIFIAALLTSLKLYAKLGVIAGAGSIVPITGFSNSVVSPAIEYKSEGYVLGIGANMFKVAGPVLVFGIGSSIIVGIIYYVLSLI